ncbi:UNVERIFIED_CONTAM: hypothetical protein GTU68_028020 [Idotea baltica]|nr:hypothetical protein [Idotea baltica]
MILSTSKLLKLKQFSFSKNIYFKVNLSNYYQLPKYLISKKIISGNRYRHNESTGTGSDNIFGKMAATIQQSSSFLVMAGAGLSTPSGIPDFRSPDTGLYAKLQKYNLPYPEAIFDIDYFMMDSKPFFTLAQDLYPGVWHKPNVGHFFLRLLQMEKKLQRLYTQNIDGLERLAGITEDKLVESHGTFSSATCTLCCEKHDINMVKDSILSGNTPIICRRKGCKGQVKPDIVFFGENLPKKFWNFEEDVLTTDALLVIGTSLEVIV